MKVATFALVVSAIAAAVCLQGRVSACYSGDGFICYPQCDDEDNRLLAAQEETRVEVLDSIGLLSNFPVQHFPGYQPLQQFPTHQTLSDNSLQALYQKFSERFGETVSDSGYSRFAEAVDEIASGKREACSGPDHTKPLPQLIRDFNVSFFGEDRSTQEARRVIGQMLCVEDQTGASGRLRRETGSCDCPPGGFTDATCVCQFFNCLDEYNDWKPIIGFTHINDFACIAFVLDVTGSMRNAIEGAKKIITDLVRHQQEENGEVCYILVPFGDNGFPNNSVGPITYADTEKVDDLITFLIKLNEIEIINGAGGDIPEYAFDAMLQALRYDYPTGSGLFALQKGSHMVVLTNAPSKNVDVADRVIELAKDNVCIHFFLGNYDIYTGPDPELSFEAFDRIAEMVSGILTPSLNADSLDEFIASYESEECEYVTVEIGKRKRSSPILPQCHRFNVSSLAYSVLISINSTLGALPPVNVTRPDNSTYTPDSIRREYTLVSETDPQPGLWSVCAPTANTIEVSAYPKYRLDTVVMYTVGDSVTTTPQICARKITILTSQAPLMRSVSLELVTSEGGGTVRRIPMSICNGSLVARVGSALSYGEFTYHLDGNDTLGNPFAYDVKNVAKFTIGEYTLTPLDGHSTEVELNSDFTLSFELNSPTALCNTTFIFSIGATGFHAVVTPQQAVFTPGHPVRVQAQPTITSSAVQPGTSHIFTLTAASANTTITATKTVTITAPPPPPTDTAAACGCENGGTCVITIRRGRERRRCRCPPGYIGVQCHVSAVTG